MNEIHSPNWAVVKDRVEKRIEYMRKQNDSTAHDQVQTAVIRGQIQALKWLLALPEEEAQRLQTPPPGFPGSEQF